MMLIVCVVSACIVSGCGPTEVNVKHDATVKHKIEFPEPPKDINGNPIPIQPVIVFPKIERKPREQKQPRR